MKEAYFQSEGIVINSLPFKERDKIITLFTKERGVIKLYLKGKLLSHHALTERFTIGDYLYSQGRGDLFQFCEGAVVDQNLHLRGSWDSLVKGEKMLEAIQRSQWPGKAAPQLYELFTQFIKREASYTAFLLKVLKHEGILQRGKVCSHCDRMASHRYGGEKYCSSHAPGSSLGFDETEEEMLDFLFEAKTFELIQSHPTTATFNQKVETLFSQVFE
jgi:DNA repair protein RecO (recombination protein O)